MGNFYRLVSLFVIIGAAAACRYEAPKVEPINIDAGKVDIDQIFATCNEENLAISDEQWNARLIIEDKIASQETESSDCDGKIHQKGIKPVRYLDKSIVIPVPPNLQQPVNFVRVENTRTCAVQSIQSESEQEIQAKEKARAMQDPNVLLASWHTLRTDGKLELDLTDSTVKIFSSGLNVHEGRNLITVKYFGKCLKYSDGERNGEDATECETAEELGQSQVAVEVIIERHTISGTRRLNSCTK